MADAAKKAELRSYFASAARGLDRVSITCLPKARHDENLTMPGCVSTMDMLASRGVVYGRDKLEDRDAMSQKLAPKGVKGTMFNVVPPNNGTAGTSWGIICERDSGTNWSGYLIDDQRRAVARIQWVSKGAYDNYAWIHALMPISGELPTLASGWVLENGEYVHGVHDMFIEMYCEMVYQYEVACLKRRIAEQEILDKEHQVIQSLADRHPEVLECGEVPDRFVITHEPNIVSVSARIPTIRKYTPPTPQLWC